MSRFLMGRNVLQLGSAFVAREAGSSWLSPLQEKILHIIPVTMLLNLGSSHPKLLGKTDGHAQSSLLT